MISLNTVKNEIVIEFEEKKSKFLGYIKPVQSVKDAEDFINNIKKMHPNATHNVPIYRVIENGQEYFKYNDDGEPTNTAGKPMAEILNILDIYNVAIVATRYFGGVKLGAGGLIRNYAKTAKIAVNDAEIINFAPKTQYIIDFDYTYTAEIESFISANARKIVILEKNYADRVTIKLETEIDIEKELEEYNKIIIIKC